MRTLLSFVLAGGLLTATTFAQRGGPMGGMPPGFDPITAKLFGSIKSFSAKAEMTISSPRGEMTMSSVYEMLDGKVRMEIDMANMHSAQIPPEAIAQMKMMGMDRMVNIMLPGTRQMYLIYPALQSYAEIPVSQAGPTADAGKEPKIDYAEVGKETIDGHPCVKSKWTTGTDDSNKREGFVWAATDLKGFPLQIQLSNSQGQVTMQFKDVQLKDPDAAHFTPPADFTKYDSPREMMQAAAQKMMGAGGMPGMTPPR
jgi:outer membrane lipoprotein-sorting protein